MTFGRGLTAALLPVYTARRGKHPTTVFLAGAATDAEGIVARFIDKIAPGWGTSDLGERADPIADATLGAGANTTILTSHRSSCLAKVSAAICSVKVAKQAAWAAETNYVHNAVFNKPYAKKPSATGKIGTVAMFAGQGLAMSTIELGDSGRHDRLRLLAGAAAVGFSLTGLMLGNKACSGYSAELQEEIRAHYAQTPQYLQAK